MTFLSQILFSQDVIYSEVSGDSVIIHHNKVHRNCGALYRMEFEIEDNQITVFEVDTGNIAYCMCWFNLAVTVAQLEAGDYNADVWHIDFFNDTSFCGSTEFTIENGGNNPQKSSQFQSDCYEYNSTEDFTHKEFGNLKIYPNPFNDKTIISFSFDEIKNAQLLIYNLTGQTVKEYQVRGSRKHEISWNGTDKNMKKVKAGLYFIKLKSGSNSVFRKIIVF